MVMKEEVVNWGVEGGASAAEDATSSCGAEMGVFVDLTASEDAVSTSTSMLWSTRELVEDSGAASSTTMPPSSSSSTGRTTSK